jgi:putative RecB family exonuclease
MTITSDSPADEHPVSGLTMDASALHVEGPTLERISRTRVSPSTANAMYDCAARWAGEKSLAPTPDPFSPSELGTGAHTVLEDLYALDPAERTDAAAMSSLMRLAETTLPDDPVRRQMWLTEVAGKYRGIFDMEAPAEIDVLAREESINDVEIGGIPFVGVIDRVERTSDDRVKIVDYKTGKHRAANPHYRDDYSEQMRLYALAWQAKYDEPAKLAYLYFTAEGKKRQVAVAKNKLAETEKGFVVAGERLFDYQDSGRFPVKPGPLCGWCPLVNLCPAAAADGRVARVPAPAADDLDIPIVNREAPAPAASDAPAGASDEPSSDTGGRPQKEEQKVDISLTDDKPYYDMPLGSFNLTSYAAVGTFGTVGWAYELIRDSPDVDLSVDAIRSFSQVLADIILSVQQRMVSVSGWQKGSNQRVRGLLRTLIDDTPPPFGGDSEEWNSWIDQIAERCAVLASTAVLLYYDELPATSEAIAFLAGEEPPEDGDEPDEDADDEEDAVDEEYVDDVDVA